jgi:hypothetical protein
VEEGLVVDLVATVAVDGADSAVTVVADEEVSVVTVVVEVDGEALVLREEVDVVGLADHQEVHPEDEEASVVAGARSDNHYYHLSMLGKRRTRRL